MITENTINQTLINENQASFFASTLNIRVANLGQLKFLIEDVQIKQRELNKAVLNLSLFELKVNLSHQEVDLHHQENIENE